MRLSKSKRNLPKADEDRQKILVYKKFFAAEEGRHVLYDLADRYHVLNPINSGTEIDRAYKEGQRSVLLEILRINHVDMADFDRMLRGELYQEKPKK